MRARSLDRTRGPAETMADALTDIPRLLMEVDRLNAAKKIDENILLNLMETSQLLQAFDKGPGHPNCVVDLAKNAVEFRNEHLRSRSAKDK